MGNTIDGRVQKRKLEFFQKWGRNKTALAAALAVIFCVAYVLFFHGLGAISLWDPDEPRQAIEAHEMMQRADYIHPYLNGEPYLEKPPLYPWLIVAVSKIHGRPDEIAARLPSALSAAILVILIFFAGRKVGGTLSGLLSALVLATNFQFLGNARESVMDMTFALFIGLAICLGARTVENNKRWLLVCALLPTVPAVLAKGPAGLMIPVAVLFLFLLSERKAGRFFVPLLSGCVLALCLSSIWFLVAGKEYLREFVLRQNMTRYFGGFDHIESLYYYFPKLFFNFLPWSCVLPFAVYHAYRRRLWLPLIWFGFTFVFFELSSAKRAIYLLPLYPAMALLVGLFLKEKWRTILTDRWSRIACLTFGLVIAAFPLVGFVPIKAVSEQIRMMGGDMSIFGSLIVLSVLGFVFLFLVSRRIATPGLVVLLVYLVFAGFVNNTVYMPAKDRSFKSVRPIVERLEGFPSTQKVYSCGAASPALIYYLGRPVKTIVFPEEMPAEGIVVAKVKDKCGEELASRLPCIARVWYEKDLYSILISP